MISVNLIVPLYDSEKIQNSCAEDFVIRARGGYMQSDSNMTFFLVETTEEQFTFLRLKYGNDNVWKR
jgi:hypothetical protein